MKTSKKMKIPVRRNVGEMARQHIAKGDFIKWLREAIANSLDEYPDGEDFSSGECLVEIELEHGKHIRVTDWAEGFRSKQVKGFFDYFRSVKKGDSTKTGHIGSGRAFAFDFCTGIEVWSRSKDYPDFVHFTLLAEHLLAEDEMEADVETDVEPPPYWNLEGTGTIINLVGVNWRKVRTLERTFEELPLRLSKFTAELVRIKGGSGQGKRLPERKHAKEPLRGSEVHDHLGGLCRWDLFVPASGGRREKSVMLGGSIMPILDINKFLEGMDPNLTAKLPEVLTEGVIVGDILIPGLNKFRLQDSESLKQEVYERFAIDVFALLMKLGAQAEEYFSVHQEDEKRKAQEAFLDNFTRRVNGAQGVEPEPIYGDVRSGGGRGGIINRGPFLVSPRDVAIVRGTGVTQVMQGYARTSGEFDCRVEPKGSDCISIEQSGTEFVVTGENEGDATIVYFDKKDTSKEVRSTVSVVAKSGMQLTPLSGTIVQGSAGKAAIAHPEMLQENQVPKYSVTGAPAGAIRLVSRARGGRRSVGIEVTQACPPGTYTIVAEIPGSDLRAECTRTVVASDVEDAVVPLVLEGSFYRITPTRYAQSVLVEVMGEQFHPRMKDPFREIRVKMNHALLEESKNGDRELLVLGAIVNAHLDAQEVDSGERMGRYDKLLTDIVLGGLRTK